MSESSVRTTESFRRAAQRISNAARSMGSINGQALRMIGEEIMTDVKASAPGHGVPVDQGTLRSTGRVDGPSAATGKPSVTLSFGGAAAPYALTQHENMSYRHTVGEPRYLVRGVERWTPSKSGAWAWLRKRLNSISRGGS